MLETISTQNYYTYLNLNSSPKTFSVIQNGLVVDNPEVIQIDKGTFRVRKGGHAQAVKEQVRNVHAFVVCKPQYFNPHDINTMIVKHGLPTDAYFPVHYHYNNGDFFSINFHGKIISLDEDHTFSGIWMAHHKCYLPKTEVFEYLLNKLLIKEILELVHPDLHNKFNQTIDEILNIEQQLLKCQPQEVIDYDSGICDNLFGNLEGYFGESELPKTYSYRNTLYNCVLYHVFESWPHFSGNTTYPVSDRSSKYNPRDQFDELPKWAGKQRELRFNLLRHIKNVINS